MERPEQNANLKAAWAASGHAQIFRAGSPFHDPAQPRGRREILRLAGNGNQRICLPMALTGVCYSNCGGYHGVLTQAEVTAVAQAGGLQVAGI